MYFTRLQLNPTDHLEWYYILGPDHMHYWESFLSRTSVSPLILVAKRTHVLAYHGTMR